MKPYVTAMTAARMIGVSIERVVADIDAGRDGNPFALAGDERGGVWYLHSYELEGERLDMHRARLTIADREDGSHG